MKRVVIVGGGASGILAAIDLKRNLKEEIMVTIIEKEERLGKKILQTGNGKCNFTNLNLKASSFNNPEFIKDIIEKYDAAYLRNYFASLGILSKVDEEGRVYPLSESSASFLNILLYYLKFYNVKVICNETVKSVLKREKTYLINDKYEADYLILALGGKARVKNYDFALFNSLSLEVTKDFPGLTSIKVKETYLKSLSGLRVKAHANLIKDNKVIYSNKGEVLFKDDSLSGILIFSLSRLIKKGKYAISLDLVNDLDKEYLLNYLRSLNGDLTLEIALENFLPKMLGLNILKINKLDSSLTLKDLKDSELEDLITTLKNLTFEVVSLNDYNNAQIMIGGLSLKELDANLELKKYPSVFGCGECLDIDGECGGFNLSWAWASALHISEIIQKDVNY